MSTEILKEWIVNFLKNKDAFLRTIVSIKEDKDKVIVQYKDKTMTYYLKPKLENKHEFKPDDHVGIVCFNTKENIGALVRDWYKLAEFKNLTVYFVNPNSSGEKKWIVKPHVHNKITEASALKKGFEAMAELVEEWVG